MILITGETQCHFQIILAAVGGWMGRKEMEAKRPARSLQGIGKKRCLYLGSGKGRERGTYLRDLEDRTSKN